MKHRAKSNRPDDCNFVSKGGLKLAFALSHFSIQAANKTAADLGSHQGGFVDCLLQNQAQKVYSVDTCYGTLAWKLRQDPRVVLYERTNALHWRSPEPLDLVTIDVGWTKQEHIIPIALRSIKPSGEILSLLKGQYEISDKEKRILTQEEVLEVAKKLVSFFQPKFQKIEYALSPYPGSAGNHEVWFYLAQPVLT
ncbi:MAG: TlyA family RNA methyltransferase [Candidatus Brocadiae bacterium]|nr:TlyA family RNA methyltransferase [Candidatus Brocadiia bacterium]